MDLVLQEKLPFASWLAPATRRLPGIQPLAECDWLLVDEAYAGQLAVRKKLMAEQRDDVLERIAGADAAERELRDTVLAWMANYGRAFSVGDGRVKCPDGRVVTLSDDPMVDLAHLVQEDFCILIEGTASEHILASGLLCFPASWTLSEKIGRPLTTIHAPVEEYSPQIARRVQRLFDAVRVGQPLWRQNALIYGNPALFQPRREDAPRSESGGAYLRSERQSLYRLPKTGAVVFAIHTYVLPLNALDPVQRAGLADVAQVS